MKLTPLEVPTSLLRQPQDGNSNSQSCMNRPVTSNNTNLNKTQKGAEAMHYLEFVLIIVAAKKRKVVKRTSFCTSHIMTFKPHEVDGYNLVRTFAAVHTARMGKVGVVKY